MTHLPRAVVRALAAPTYRLGLNAHLPVGVQRAATEAAARLAAPPRGSRTTRIRLAGRPAERSTCGPVGDRAVLYLHGGGYVLGSARMYRSLAAHLSRSSSAAVFALDYRRAPEHPCPAAVQDATAAFDALVDEHGYHPDRIALAGDSAGGGLAVAAARRLTDAGRRPAALALLSPWTDPADAALTARDLVVNRAWGRRCAELYRGDCAADDPEFAPIHGRLDGLPPMRITRCPAEILYAQIGRFADAARAAGVPVQVVDTPQLWHSAQQLAGLLRAATVEVEDIAAFLAGRFAAVDSDEPAGTGGLPGGSLRGRGKRAERAARAGNLGV